MAIDGVNNITSIYKSGASFSDIQTQVATSEYNAAKAVLNGADAQQVADALGMSKDFVNHFADTLKALTSNPSVTLSGDDSAAAAGMGMSAGEYAMYKGLATQEKTNQGNIASFFHDMMDKFKEAINGQ